MKKLTILLLLIVFVLVELEAKKVEGQIHYEDKIVDVTFQIPVFRKAKKPNFEGLQYRIVYYDENGEAKKLKPNQAKEVRFIYENKTYRMISMKKLAGFSMKMLRDKIFLRLAIDGNLKLYYYYDSSSAGGPGIQISLSNVERFIFQKNNGSLVHYNGLAFRSFMTEYFKDCPSLSKKIEEKEFQKKDLEAIVNYYNMNCL